VLPQASVRCCVKRNSKKKLIKSSSDLLRISAPLRADMFVRWLLPTKNKTKQKMACHVFDAFATYSSLVHDVSNTDCDSLAQNGSTHSRFFETLKLSIFKKPDVKIELCFYC